MIANGDGQFIVARLLVPVRTVKMKIWLDTLSHNDYVEGDCKDCSRSGGFPASIAWPSISNEMMLLQKLTLQLSQELYIQECDDGKWLVCNPSRSARVAVLDTQAMLLLAVFQEPTSFSHMICHWPDKDIEKFVALFYRLSFLQDVDVCSLLSSFGEAYEESQTLTAWLHVTNECNLRCHYCYLQKTHDSMSADMGLRSVNAIFRSAQKHNIKNIKLKYAGGEASLHMMSVVNLHDYASQLAKTYDITLNAVILSNGITLSQRSIDQLKARQIAVMISLDGLGIYHDSQRPLLGGQGSSKYVRRTIDRLLANDVVPFLSVTVSQRNLIGLPELMEYILERALPFSLNYYRDNSCSSHIADLRFADEQMIVAMRSAFAVIGKNLPERSLLGCLLDKVDMSTPHRRTCGVGQNYLVINQRGDVAKCQMEIDQTITTVDTDDPLRFVKEDRRGVQGMPVEEKEGCRTCSWRYWCTGGCPVVTYRATGRYDIKSPNCNIYKALFPDVLRLEALRLLRYRQPFNLIDMNV